MSPTNLSAEQIQQSIDFHGHECPGLAIGIRAAEVALREIGPHAADEETVAVVETDMCGVDAIQFLTGCTLGKGNLILRDLGKMAFTFFRRSDGKGIRVLLRPKKEADPEADELKKKRATVGLTPEEEQLVVHKRKQRTDQILQAELDELFEVQPAPGPVPARARLLPSLTCERCEESTMESRTRRLMGQILCIPCFETLQKR